MPANYKQLASGMFYEELEPGTVYKHSITRTVTEADNLLFSTLTYNMAWLHVDDEYCKNHSMFGQRLVNSNFTLSLVAGVQVHDMTLGTTLANMGYSDVKFPNPVFIGDTIYSETEVLSKRESKSRPTQGIVKIRTRGLKQDGTEVISFERAMLIPKRGHAVDDAVDY